MESGPYSAPDLALAAQCVSAPWKRADGEQPCRRSGPWGVGDSQVRGQRASSVPSPACAESRPGQLALLGPLWQKAKEFALVMGQVPKHKTSLRQSRGQACAGDSWGWLVGSLDTVGTCAHEGVT